MRTMFAFRIGPFIFTAATLLGSVASIVGQNQTGTTTAILSNSGLPFTIAIQQANFSLPSGLQSFVVGTSGGKWLLLAGRINGLHGFDPNNNFPPNEQNVTVFVVDPQAQTVATRMLTDPGSGLTQAQVDLLSVTDAQAYQSGGTLYMSGGYGIDTASGNFTTKDALSAIDVTGLMRWVTDPDDGKTAAQYIRQIFNPMLRITGGSMVEASPGHALLIFGQDFEGDVTVSGNGIYSNQVRPFQIINTARRFAIVPGAPMPAGGDPNYRRANMNVVPFLVPAAGRHYRNKVENFVAFSGVFTPGFGIWTVPVEITNAGVPSMANPNSAGTFKQGMNNFSCATMQLISQGDGNSYTVLLGGISFGFFGSGGFNTDPELPFINQVTTIKRDRHGVYAQYLMDGEYPVIPSAGSNPGNPLLFGTGAAFIPANGLIQDPNGGLEYDDTGNAPVVAGYIVGGIQSTLPNTNTRSDTAASPYIFTVTVTPTP